MKLVLKIFLFFRLSISQTRNLKAYILFVLDSFSSMEFKNRNLDVTCHINLIDFPRIYFAFLAYLIYLAFIIHSTEFLFFTLMLSSGLLWLRKTFPYSEFFWSVFFRIRTEYKDLQSKAPYSVQMQETRDQKNSGNRNFLRSVYCSKLN